MNLFFIPKKIINEWRKIGDKASKKSLHQKNYQKNYLQ